MMTAWASPGPSSVSKAANTAARSASKPLVAP